MFELKVRVKSHWLLFHNGIEVRSGSKIFIRHWLNRFYPEIDYKSLKVTRLPPSTSAQTMTNVGWWCNLENR